jgi:peptidoglycan/xylan/chitin deacetylase (PgdA/CDA1 family)
MIARPAARDGGGARTGGARSSLRGSLLALAAALALVLAASLLAAAGAPAATGARLALVLAAWALLGLLLAYLFLPGFDLPGRVVRRARAADGARAVALTFDDGPHPETTPALLDALDRAGVRATFFLVGENARRWPELARRIAAAGHVVGNHTQRHRLLVFRTQAQLEEEIAACQRTLRTLGLQPSLFRPPHGFKPVGLHRALARHRLRLVAWQGAVRDTDAPGAAAVAARVLRRARPGRIVLLHDNPTTRGHTAEALAAIVEGCRARGLTFVTL